MPRPRWRLHSSAASTVVRAPEKKRKKDDFEKVLVPFLQNAIWKAAPLYPFEVHAIEIKREVITTIETL